LPERRRRNRDGGVRHLLAAYDPATGRLSGHIRATKTWRQVRELLRTLRARFTEHLIVILDNFRHKKELGDWVRERDIELVFLPTYSSWLNLIECQCAALRRFALNGTDYRSHTEQDPFCRDPRIPALAQPQQPASETLAHQGRGASFAPERCGMRH
jgi:hypothetical protein